jgi:hypothetical protein
VAAKARTNILTIRDSYRARAVRFLRYYNQDIEWLIPLLDEDIPEVRHLAAMHLARDWPDRADDKVLACLVEAPEDSAWTWADHFASSRIGREEALDVLARIADRPIAMATPRRAEHARLQQEESSVGAVGEEESMLD